MEKEVLGFCPVCSKKLTVTELTCKNCNLQLKGDFSLNKYSYLTKEESEFLEVFLKAEGSFKAVQEELDITYFKAKENLGQVLKRLGLREGEEMITSKPVEINALQAIIKEEDHFIKKLIKEKLNAHGGRAELPLIQAGKRIVIGFEEDGSGLVCDKIPVPNQLIWEAFIAAYNILVMSDGEVYKGYARAGKLGSDKLPVDSLEGYIAYSVHGVKEGESAFAPGFAIAAVLDWIGVIHNERGATLKVIENAVTVKSYEEALDNAKVFIAELASSDTLKDRLQYFRHWYYFDEIDAIAPSKFVGYLGMDSRSYEAYTKIRGNIDGKETKRILTKFFDEAGGSRQEILMAKLESQLSEHQAQPNANARVHVRK
jgi:hypothetical protein